MKKTRKLSAIILATIMAISVYSPTNATESILQEASPKIQSDLHSVMLSSEKIEEIPVDIWLYQPFSNEQLEKEIDSKIGLNKKKINQSEERTMSAKKVDEYIETERALYSEKMNALYKDFLKDYSKIKALNETRKNKRLFFSQYAPLISAELTPAEIKQLAKDDRVQSIYYSPDVEIVPDSDVSFPLIKADVVRDTIGYTGSGMKIGLLEAFGLPRKDLDYFNSANIIYDPNVDIKYDQEHLYHPTIVAAIIVGKSITVDDVTYKGIVPDAKLYATYSYSGDSSDWRSRVEWLLSQGVHVINMSAGSRGESAGNYGTRELWVDHIALNHSVHFVKSAGNDAGSVTGPGMAYNIITVGAINDKNTLATGDDEIYSESNFEEDSQLTNKPDLMAPGENITVASKTYTGTSLSAPHVTAVIAQLCQWHTTLRTKQDAMKAILTASMNHSEHVYTPTDSEYNQYGAGVINAQEALYTINQNNYVSSSFAANTPAATYHYYNFNVTSKTKKRVSLTWLKYSYLTGTHANPTQHYEGTLSNLSLLVLDPNNNPVAYSIQNYGNTEIVEFDAHMTGTYRISVNTVNSSDRTTYYAVSWYF